jgi:NAD+ synthase
MSHGLLQINAKNVIEELISYLRKLVADVATEGVILGLSGGIDSAVLATTTVRALGSQAVHFYYLFDQHSNPQGRRNARMVSRSMHVDLKEISIESIMRSRGVYGTLGRRLTSLSGNFNRILFLLYKLLFKESPFVSSLRARYMPDELGFRMAVLDPEGGMNARHRYRREYLEIQAREQNLLLLGAANRTEWLVGWFVKHGIDDLPIQPLIGLYKSQVRQLGQYLGLPRPILDQSPTPDMVKGITDEFALGLSYEKIDLILDYLAGGLSKETILSASCSESDILHVTQINHYSGWKRGETDYLPPVDGGPNGGVRLA